ncbi:MULTISPECIES: hypothetical protein [Bacillaceae]|uniref:YqgU-like beta propeller domain-containing protein n=1 Tax=Bacillaceae TaxID=186817 RepID=UPI001BDE578D|nr:MULTISPECIES: hypothetical protein [Bacillaceae]MDX8359601.1 hypothetical protein [Cytobacillus sp. IB215316]
MRWFWFVFSLIIVVTVVTGCFINNGTKTIDKQPSLRFVNDLTKGKIDQLYTPNSAIQPIDVDERSIQTVGDWYDDTTILYITNENEGSTVYKHNIYSGKKEQLYKSSSEISTIKGNHNQSYFLLHTLPTTYEAELVIVDKEGKEVFKWATGSYELNYEWNPYNPELLYVTTFFADWSFETYLLNVSKQSVQENTIDIPFIQWAGIEEVTYLKWNQDEPSYSAPLYEQNLQTKQGRHLIEDVSMYATTNNLLMTITTDGDSIAYYSFYQVSPINKMTQMEIPLLALYSQWFFPYFDFIESKDEFITFAPYGSGNYDSYHDDFELITYSVLTGEKKSILSNIANLPINMSPNGELCLYGYYNEKIINLNDKNIYELVQL